MPADTIWMRRSIYSPNPFESVSDINRQQDQQIKDLHKKVATLETVVASSTAQAAALVQKLNASESELRRKSNAITMLLLTQHRDEIPDFDKKIKAFHLRVVTGHSSRESSKLLGDQGIKATHTSVENWVRELSNFVPKNTEDELTTIATRLGLDV